MSSPINANSNVKKAVTVIRELSADERLREQVRRREDALFNERSALYAERNYAIDKTQSAFVSVLRDMGMDEDTIKETLRRVQDILEHSLDRI